MSHLTGHLNADPTHVKSNRTSECWYNARHIQQDIWMLIQRTSHPTEHMNADPTHVTSNRTSECWSNARHIQQDIWMLVHRKTSNPTGHLNADPTHVKSNRTSECWSNPRHFPKTPQSPATPNNTCNAIARGNSLILQAALRQSHSPSQSQFSTQCDLVLPLSIYSSISFP